MGSPAMGPSSDSDGCASLSRCHSFPEASCYFALSLRVFLVVVVLTRQRRETNFILSTRRLTYGEMVQLMIQYRADINRRERTPLHLASESSSWRAETVQLLIQLGVNVNAQDESQSTPLHGVVSGVR